VAVLWVRGVEKKDILVQGTQRTNEWWLNVATLRVWPFSACTILMTTLKKCVYLSLRLPELHQLYELFLIPELARVGHSHQLLWCTVQAHNAKN